jgi:hypothetical protein
VQAEVILERRIHARQHLNVGAGREEFVARSGQQNDVNVIFHTRAKNRLVELAIHLVGISIGRRIAHLNDRYAAVFAVVDQLLGGFASRWLHCGCHFCNSLFLHS